MAISRSYLKLVDGERLDFDMHIWIHQDIIQLRFYRKDKSKKKPFATIQLNKILGWATWETHFVGSLPKKYKNKRYGIYFYSRVADFCSSNWIKMVSSLTPSFEARRMWQSKILRKFYKVKFKNNRYHIWRKL